MSSKGLKKGEIVVALAANPNVGKSTLFNALTGETAHVANWPGVTVSVNQGHLTHHGVRVKIVDLPGSYGLSAGAKQVAEAITGEFITRHKPDVVVVLADATALERTLYMAILVLELTGKAVLALNMMDVAAKRAIHIDIEGLERGLGIPVVGVSALKEMGLGALLDRILDVAEGRAGRAAPLRVDYGPLEPYISEIESLLADCPALATYPSRWAAVKLMEGDPSLVESLAKADPQLLKKVEGVRARAEAELRVIPEEFMVQARYELISSLLRGKIKVTRLASLDLAERLDRIALHPIVGPIFSLLVLFSAFAAVFAANTGSPVDMILGLLGFERAAELVGEYSLVSLIGGVFDSLAGLSSEILLNAGYPEWVASLLADGVVSGMGLVLSFLPLVFTVFVLLGVLQDSGLMARVAVSLDQFFRRFGVSGRAVFPAVIGFGCNVPAILATRAMDDDRERVVTALAVPMIPCQARLIVTVALAASIASTPAGQAAVLVGLYTLQILLYLITALVMNRLVFSVRTPSELLLEVPPYHTPSLKVAWWYARTNSLHFLKKAGTVIFAANLAFWAILHVGPSGYVSSIQGASASLGGIVGRYLEPAGALVGLGDWRVILALLAGFIAREAVLTTLASMTGAADPLSAIAALNLSPLQALSLAVLSMAYTPCAATLAVIKQEVRLMSLLLKQLVYQLGVAIALAGAIYWLGLLLFS